MSESKTALEIDHTIIQQCRSAELISRPTFKRILRTELFDIAYSERSNS